MKDTDFYNIISCMTMIKSIYCDFDGTITKEDSVNKFLEMYAPNWLDSKKLWIEGKISSRENAIIQVGLLKNVSQKQLDDYINSIETDDYLVIKFMRMPTLKCSEIVMVYLCMIPKISHF